MKKASDLLNILGDIQNLSPEMGGVFSYADLSNIIAGNSAVKNSRIIKRLVNNKMLVKIQRGIYTAKSFDIGLLICRLEPDSYISMDTALAQHGIISTLPARRSSVIYLKPRGKHIKTPAGEIVFHSISKDLFFGFERKQNGSQIATPEKAYLDTLYFYQKGCKFVIDPLREINLDRLNTEKIKKYLNKYKNPKFIKFVKGLL